MGDPSSIYGDPARPAPTGTVTFLFTDIEGSTKRWERDGVAMQVALRRHDELVREAIRLNDGHVFKTVGDAFYATFDLAPRAAAAARDIQRSLSAEDFSAIGGLTVRIALHTGHADQRDGDYFGPALNRVARLLAIAHGGQTLLSAATAALVDEHLPAGTAVRDLGVHRLKDLDRPEHVSQLEVADLPNTFPALRSLDSIVPNTLPTQITSFVGRERELSTVQQLLDTSRLVTLTGVGGAGKSRLSVQAASAVADRYPDGVWFVELAPLAQADLVPQTVATALGIREEASRPIRETLLDTLARKKSLIVLDNCEHLIASCALLTDALIRTCPTLSVLASSREPLQISGETTFRVPPLAFADPDRLPPLERLANEYEAIRLFCERAAAAKPAFTLDAANARAIARICSQLDGIPLAIELAAARVNVLTPNQIAERLQDRFKLLTGGSRTALPRQQTLRALIDWSYDLLTEPEKTLLCRLSVFAGGCTLEAAEAVCADNVLNRDEIFDVLCSLVEKSLVVADDKGRHARYRLLETLRQYGREKLSLDEAAATELRHVQHFLNVLGECDAAGYYSSRIDDLDLLTSEYDNFRAAMAWAAAQTSPAERSLGACIAVHLHDLWFVRGECDEGLGWLAAARANDVTDVPGHSITWMGVRVPATGACIRSLALTRSAQIAWVHTDYQKAKAFLAEARQVPDSVEYPAIWS